MRSTPSEKHEAGGDPAFFFAELRQGRAIPATGIDPGRASLYQAPSPW